MGIKITDLPQATQINTDDIIVIVQNGETKQVNANEILSIENLISRIETLEAHDDLLPGIEIPQNANLNNYSTPGNYYASSSTITNTLSNCPFTGSGLKLVVMQTTATRIRQEAYATNNSSANTYWRTYTTGGWQPWRQVSTTTV